MSRPKNERPVTVSSVTEVTTPVILAPTTPDLVPDFTPLKFVEFYVNLAVAHKQLKAIDLESYQDLQLHSNHVSFTDGKETFLVPLSNVLLMIKL